MAAGKDVLVKDADAKDVKGRSERIALVLLDRDGVLCDIDAEGVLNLSMFKLVPGLVESLSRLNGENFRIGIITNQPSVADGKLLRGDLDRMNEIIKGKAAEAGIKPGNFVIEVCMHGKNSDCNCRKPKTGLVKKVVEDFKLNPKDVDFYIVGDMIREVQTLKNYYEEVLKPAGIDAKAKTTILLNWKHGRDKGNISEELRRMATPDYEVHSLDDALKLIQAKEIL